MIQGLRKAIFNFCYEIKYFIIIKILESIFSYYMVSSMTQYIKSAVLFKLYQKIFWI